MSHTTDPAHPSLPLVTQISHFLKEGIAIEAKQYVFFYRTADEYSYITCDLWQAVGQAYGEAIRRSPTGFDQGKHQDGAF
jgi:hypothetical protein